MSNLKKMRVCVCVCMCARVCIHVFICLQAESLKAYPAAGKLPKATRRVGGLQRERAEER